MKQLLVFFIMLFSVFVLWDDKAHANTIMPVFLDEQKLSFDEDPVAIRGVTYIELRGLCGALNYQLGWNQQTKTASCSGGGRNFSFSFNDTHYMFNNQRREFINTPRAINGRTMLSLREVSEVFDYRVLWLSFSNEILLMSRGITDETRGRMADDFLQRLNAANRFNGSALVAKRNSVITSSGYGLADQAGRANQPNTPFAIASLTKGFTGSAIMKLHEEGKLQFTDRLSDYFPELPYANQISIHQLLTHTAGLPWEKEGQYKDIKLIYTPGTSQRYSNVGYMLLGDIIEQVSGKSYSAYLNDQIFKPLGMNSSGFDINTVDRSVRAHGYSLVDGRVVPVNRDFAARGGSGSVYASVEDLYKLDRALYQDTLHSRSIKEVMLRQHESNWGYGWQVYPTSVGRVTQLSGNTVGYTSHIKRHEGLNYTIILLSNHANKDVHVIGQMIEHIIRN
ncbi:serine hydrolase [Alkalihalophilus marmarensis]|uniref:CubicO group peptidase, beta-lactamase class C family n=1 Tax=Alkalihalophilus marmarensis DSM 21297 TaxID=1188261 RepID=U6SKD1_9BACI|nr:serine hydrolase [Alkalihalophilus marmarensis]ERN52053.1 hypothetical protein A33I_18340 [Alkalihalophilus marmarensis DSM 21297]